MVGHIPESVQSSAVAPDEDEAGDLVFRVEAPPLLEAEVDGYLVAVKDEDSLVSEDVGGGLERPQGHRRLPFSRRGRSRSRRNRTRCLSRLGLS